MPLKISSFCCYPEGFGVPEDSRLNISVHSMEEVMNISQSVIDFCKDKGIDSVTSFRAGLCVEDPVRNIGIRIVRKVCRSMEYYPLLGLNVLTIKM